MNYKAAELKLDVTLRLVECLGWTCSRIDMVNGITVTAVGASPSPVTVKINIFPHGYSLDSAARIPGTGSFLLLPKSCDG